MKTRIEYFDLIHLTFFTRYSQQADFPCFFKGIEIKTDLTLPHAGLTFTNKKY